MVANENNTRIFLTDKEIIELSLDLKHIINLNDMEIIGGKKDMLNQTVIVGRLVRDPELKETENGKKVSNITLAVPRSFKNKMGEYETDFIDITLWESIAQNTVEYVKKGDLLGVKGRISTENIIEKDINKNKMVLIGEKVTFLSTKKDKEHDELTKEKDI